MARNLLRLGAKLGDDGYRDRGVRTVKAFAFALRTSPTGLPLMLRALDELLDASAQPDKPLQKEEPKAKKPRKSDDVVTAKLTLDPAKDGRRAFTLELKVDEPWHLYANPVGPEMLAESRTEVAVYVGARRWTRRWTTRRGRRSPTRWSGSTRSTRARRPIKGSFAAGEVEVEVRVSVNACKEGLCLPSGTLKLK
jgi:hypothetical protein